MKMLKRAVAAMLLTTAFTFALTIPLGDYGNLTISSTGGISVDMDWKKVVNTVYKSRIEALPIDKICPKEGDNISVVIFGRDISEDVTKYAIKYCGEGVNKAKSKLADIDVFTKIYDYLYGSDDSSNKDMPSGKTDKEVNDNASAKVIAQNSSSAAHTAYMSGDQQVLKILINKLQKDPATKNKDINSIKAADFKVAATLREYNEEIRQLAQIAASDVRDASAYKVSKHMEKSGVNPKVIQQLLQLIDIATATKIGVAKEALSREDDYAIPTEESIKYLRDDYKIKAIAKIYNQQMREAHIITQIIQEGEARKNLVAITAEKQAILNQKFARDEVNGLIDTLINSLF